MELPRPGKIGARKTAMGEEQRTIAVDFDGVIAEYAGWEGHGTVGPPRADVIEVLKILRDEGDRAEVLYQSL
jgi:hypothetical protein